MPNAPFDPKNPRTIEISKPEKQKSSVNKPDSDKPAFPLQSNANQGTPPPSSADPPPPNNAKPAQPSATPPTDQPNDPNQKPKELPDLNPRNNPLEAFKKLQNFSDRLNDAITNLDHGKLDPNELIKLLEKLKSNN